MKRIKTIYWLATGLLSLIMLASASMYFFNYEFAAGVFERLGYPTYLVYPLAGLKILGLLTIWTRRVPLLTQWAYAGFVIDTALAVTGHLLAQDGGWFVPGLALIAAIVSAVAEREI